MSVPQTEPSPTRTAEVAGGPTTVAAGKAADVARSRARAASSQTVSRRNLLGRRQRFEARRVRRIVRHVDPWSVLKLALVFFVCVWVLFMVAVVIVWSIAQSSGTVERVESFVNDLGITGWKLNGTFVFRQYGLFGLVMVFACTTATVVSTIIFNLISDLVGGVWISVIEEETSRPING